jgi:protein-disulfide isomerase
LGRSPGRSVSNLGLHVIVSLVVAIVVVAGAAGLNRAVPIFGNSSSDGDGGSSDDAACAYATGLTVPALKCYAKDIGLDEKEFNSCLDSGKYAAEVAQDKTDAMNAFQQLGITQYGTPAFFINGVHVSGAQPFEAFKAAIDTALNDAAAGKQPTLTIDVAGEPWVGTEGASVTIVEFSDFECPYCARFVTETFGQIMDTYGDKIMFVFKNLPLPMHADAQKAAEASECAFEQGKFWEMHDKMFANQP